MKFACGCDIDPKNIDIYNLPDCPETWVMLSGGNTKGLFQIESYLGKKWIKKLQPNSIELLGALVSIIRPGVLKAQNEDGKSMTEVFCNRRHGDDCDEIDPAIKDILNKTFQIPIYQEQVMEIAKVLCNFSLQEADSLRKGIGKKDAKLVAEIRTLFIDKAEQVGLVSREKASEIYDIIEKSSRYSFNKSHAISYAALSYVTAWLKHHFPIQFYLGWLKHSRNDQDPQKELCELVYDARLNGVEICPPCLNDLCVDTYIKDDKVFLGLGQIKGIGEKSAQTLIKKIKPNMSWMDLLYTCTKKQLENLIQAGALGGNRLRKLYELEVWGSLTKLEQSIIYKAEYTNLLTALEELAKPKSEGGCCATQTRVSFLKYQIQALKHPPRSLNDTAVIISKFEQEMLGVQLTCTKSDGIDKSLINADIKSITNGQKNGMLAVEISDIKAIKVKNGQNKGKIMAFVKVYDITGEMEAVVFPDVYEWANPALLKGNNLVVKFYSKDCKSIIIQDLWQV